MKNIKTNGSELRPRKVDLTCAIKNATTVRIIHKATRPGFVLTKTSHMAVILTS